MNYNISATSPTDELLTLGRILGEVGDYASTVRDRDSLSLSQRCAATLRKVVGELVSRRCIQSAGDLYGLPPAEPFTSDLASPTIAELHDLYLNWPIRHKEREAQGREHFTFYHEGHIVDELLSRKATNQAEQFKIDYCVATYHNELDNLSFVFSLPVRIDNEKIYPESARSYTPSELVALISLYRSYRDVVEREILVEYADCALDVLTQTPDVSSSLCLLAEVAALGRDRIIHIPGWIHKKLAETISYALNPNANTDAGITAAKLALQMPDVSTSSAHRAQQVIYKCFTSVLEDISCLSQSIERLYATVACCNYIARFNNLEAATAWTRIAVRTLTTDAGMLAPRHLFQLLEIAKNYACLGIIPGEFKDGIARLLEERANAGDLESQAYHKMAALEL